ncbi:MAG: SAM-dependent methyltransferase [Thermoanaerobaculia bacterium]
MNESIRNVSDTAVWVAMYRARETDRPEGLFHDPYARRLAGERGEEIARQFKSQDRADWAYIIRTYLFDEFVREKLAEGVDLVINLAAGLDARPYRMDLPSSLRWVEVDLPDILDYKEWILRDDKPKCQLERVACDLADAAARRALFQQLATGSKKALILSEGLLIYLGEENARALAEDLSAQKTFRWWVFDIANPGLLKMLNKQVGKVLAAANAPLLFAPPEGPWFFEPLGWRVVNVCGSLKHAAKHLKLRFFFRLFALLPEKLPPRKGVWAGICLLENTKSSRPD